MRESVPLPATVVEFSDPPIEGGVIYVLSGRRHRIYTVDLNQLTCTCAFFSSTKRGVIPHRVQRYCTHLYRQAREKDFCRSLSPKHELVNWYFEHLEHSGFPIGDKFYLAEIDSNDVLLVQKASTSWVDVVTRKKRTKDSMVCTGKIERYGYNEAINRWAFGDAPFHPMKIKTEIRSLVPLTFIESQDEDIEVEFPLQDFLNLEPLKGNAHDELIDAVFWHLREIAEVSLIETSLEKLRAFKNVKLERLATEWYRHGQSLWSQKHDRAAYFLTMAKEIDPKIAEQVDVVIGAASGFQTKFSVASNVASSLAKFENTQLENKRARLAEKTSEVLDVEAEEARFIQLPSTSLKQQAEKVLRTENPEWYSRDAGHTFRGYLYVDFVRHHIRKMKLRPLKEEDATAVDYIASLAILDGTISDAVMAQIFRIKGEMALDRNEPKYALPLFQQALAYDTDVGVTKIVRRLEADAKQLIE